MSRTWHTRKGFHDDTARRKQKDPRPRYRRKGRADRSGQDFEHKPGRVYEVRATEPQGL